MKEDTNDSLAAKISLLDFLQQHGWKPLRDRGGDEIAGLCPLHRDPRPSFYVNRRKQLFYCHGCGCGGGLARLMRLLGVTAVPLPATPSRRWKLPMTSIDGNWPAVRRRAPISLIEAFTTRR